MIIKYIILLFFVSINAYTIQFSRKNFIKTSISTTIPLLIKCNKNANNPIIVIGGSGSIGKQCVKSILTNKTDDIWIISRNPNKNPIINNRISYKTADIDNIKTLINTINDARAVIVSVNTTKQEAYYNIATTCITYNIPRLIMISNPYNLYNEKIIEELYSTKKINKKIIKDNLTPTYTICRAGFLISNNTNIQLANLIVSSIDNSNTFNSILF